MQQQFQQMGLKPGNPDGTYLQNVPLAGITSKSQPDIAVKGKKLPLIDKKDYIALSSRYVPEVDVKNSGIVFVGYGVVAPEYGWDDYKDVDVKGKTILMLINDPAIPDPNDPSKLDDKMFKGAAMTYYGRWTYKYEIASQKGAAAAIIIHETGPAGYPFEVVAGSWGGENFGIQRPDNNDGPRRRGRLDDLRQGGGTLPHGRPRSGGAEESRYQKGFQAGGAAGRDGQFQNREHAAQDRFAQRGGEARRQRSRRLKTST